MKHALIIEENLLIGKLLEQQLARLGFGSFSHAWSEDDAVAIARARRPDLVLVGDEVEHGSPIEAARRICSEHEVPVLLVTMNAARARAVLPAEGSLLGPFRLQDIGDAVHRADGAPES